MTIDNAPVVVPALGSNPMARGNWPVTVTRIARVLIAIPALIGVFAWLTLIPVLLLTFLFVQPLFLIGMVMFLIAAAVGGKTILLQHYRANDIVIKAGQPSYYIYLVRSGQYEGSGDDLKSGETIKYGPGDYFGVHSLLADGRNTSTIRALSDGELVRIDPIDLSDFVGDAPQLETTLRQVLAARLTGFDRE